jgi:uncharacterized protein YegL
MGKDRIVVDGETYEKVKKSITTNVIVILDMSGSMGIIHEPTMSGYNEYINGLKSDGNKYKVSLTVFDTQEVKKVYTALPIKEVPKLTKKVYTPRAGTPLYDAVCETLSDLRDSSEETEKYLVVIITDGEENSSREYTEKDMKALKSKLEKKGNFSFVYLGANQDAWAVAQKWGFSKGNTASYNATSRGVGATFQAMSVSTSGMASSAEMMVEDYLTDDQQKEIKETK